MDQMLKVECVNCGGRYFIIAGDINLQLPKDIESGEAFPNICRFAKKANTRFYQKRSDK